jgi:hypothetical protein
MVTGRTLLILLLVKTKLLVQTSSMESGLICVLFFHQITFSIYNRQSYFSYLLEFCLEIPRCRTYIKFASSSGVFKSKTLQVGLGNGAVAWYLIMLMLILL